MEMRPGYKQSDVGIIPDDWEVKLLGDVATIKDGTHQTPKYVASGVPFFSVEHVTSGDFKNTKFISEKEHRFLTRTCKIEKGDILMTRIGSIGDCKLIDWDVDASFYVSLALLKIQSRYSAAYIAQYSKSASFQNEVQLHSLQSAIPKKINLGPISSVKIAVPPVAEQRAIATALSDVDALLAKLGQLIAKKRDLKQAAMQQLLTGQTRLPGFSGEWELKRVDEFGEVVTGGTPHTDVKKFWGEGYPPNGRVRVAAPLVVNDEAVRLAVIDKLGWIRRQKAKFADQPRQSQREMVNGESHYFLGQRYRLRVHEYDAPARVAVRGVASLDLFVRPGTSSEQREAVLLRWHREQLKALIPHLLEQWQPILGVLVADWGIKKMKTRWGSCNPAARRIWLNLELAKKPVQCLEYIVVHELVHLLERNHNDRFTALLDKHLPQWPQYREMLSRSTLGHEKLGY